MVAPASSGLRPYTTTKMERARRGEQEYTEGDEVRGGRWPAASLRQRRVRVDGGGALPVARRPREGGARLEHATRKTGVPTTGAGAVAGED
ncbi:hypothetical protein GUJ93_ZPchr0011g27501 [Zizania palustris]|uniref:Uncharacterized protein n=1 Tax=Zizania palustris TaxID=103762 RepID=A0A8J6BK56_ZIZPA|nr:hypothetical protein GUJ93_ZPchr0011g27501 [Zizania palustris]